MSDPHGYVVGCSTTGVVTTIAFPDQSPSFLHGFELGRIWQQIADGMILIEDVVSTANEAALLELGLACGYDVAFDSLAYSSDRQAMTLRRKRNRLFLPGDTEHEEVF